MSKKIFEGLVIENKAKKTVSVLVEKRVLHKKYRKIIKKSKKYQVHDMNHESNIGDTIKIIETPPISKTKKWQVLQIISRGSI